jgi:hypothetical protein
VGQPSLRFADGVDEDFGRVPAMPTDISEVKQQILKALDCGAATDGLYFRNFYQPWDEGGKPAVEAPQSQIIAALKELIAEGSVVMDDTGKEAIYHLANPTWDDA